MSFFWGSLTQDRFDGELSQEHRSIRLRRMEVCGESREIVVRLVETSDKIQAACDLINDRYAWRGYGASHRIPSSASHMTFTAELDEDIVGTLTLAVDSRRGLASDNTFKDEIDRVRALPGTRVCELTKFAFDPAVQSKKLMAALFHIVFVYGHRTHGCTDLFIEVHPRHVRFYEAMLGFEAVGSVRTNESVAAPAQLMWLEVAAIRKYIDRFAKNTDRRNTRSLYPDFFSPFEEDGIYRRLTSAEKQTAAPVLGPETGMDFTEAFHPGASPPAAHHQLGLIAESATLDSHTDAGRRISIQ